VLSGDVLFALDGHPLHSPEDLLDALLSLRPDNPAVLELGRAGRRKACVLPAGQLTLHVNRAA
jgi:S1-C subfamily serine protease